MSSKVLGFVAGFAGVAALTSVAFAQTGVPTCVTDDECPTGEWCPSVHSSDPGGTTGDPGAATEPAPTRVALYFPGEGSVACEPIPAGVCESDQDCGAGLECVKSESTAGCAPSVGGGTSACDTSVTTSRYGSCEFAPIECATDSDCPNGLTCVSDAGDLPVSGGGTGSSSGSTSSAGTKAATKYCDYVPEECTKDSDCTSDFECVISEVKACSGGTPAVNCETIVAADGTTSQDCVQPDTSAPDCQTVSSQGWCFPRKMPCNTDAECPNEYVCYEFEAGQAPDEWNTSSSVMSCLPEGLALVARSDGDYTVGIPESDSSTDDKGESASGNGDAASHLGAGKSGDGSACSVSSTQSGSTWLLSVVSLLGLCLVRRRSRAA